MNQFLLFLSNFLKNPRSVGAVVPLSQSVAKELIKFITQRDKKKTCRVLEVGAGIGNISQFILKSLGPKDKFDIIEIDQACCDVLQETFKKDKRVKVHCMSILDWDPEKQHYDYIISTLPFNMFKAEFVQKILDHYEKLLKKKGIMTYVEYIGLQKISLTLSQGKKKKNIAKRYKLLKNLQDHHLVEKKSVVTNFLPCNVYHIQFHKEKD